MTAFPSHHKPKFDREVRLGLVAYSGISLAIYMNGVCHEFYRAVRGRGIYKLLKALVDADVVVDVLSGTSAGGINSVLLSYALTNSTVNQSIDFNIFSEVWRNSGDIQKMLQKPSRKQAGQIEAILDGEGYYQQQLEAAFARAFSERCSAPESEWVSQFQELDLLVTGTDFQGKTSRIFDDMGAITEITDHRALFHLKHRQGRKEPLNPIAHPEFPALQPQDTFAALAKLCRLTSALPVVFPMVRIDPSANNSLVDRQLTAWGDLLRRSPSHRNNQVLSFLDGGLLDNAPFGPALREMYYRPPTRPIQRLLFYIDPLLQNNTPDLARPKLSRLLHKSLQEIPMYQSVANDLEAIREHNQKVERYQTLLASGEKIVAAPQYCPGPDLQKSIYLRSRTVDLRDRLLPILLRLDAGGDENRQPQLERLARLLTQRQVSKAIKESRESCLQGFVSQLAQLDVRYSLRQHFYLNHKIHEALGITQRPMERFYLESLTQQVGRSIQLLETIQTGQQQLFDRPLISDSFYQLLELDKPDEQLRPMLYEYIFRLLRYLLDVQALPLLMPAHALPPETASFSEHFINLPLQANEITSEWLPPEEISLLFQQLQEKIDLLTTAAQQGRYLWNQQRFHYDRRENQRFLSILTQIESATTILLHNSPAKAASNLLRKFQSFEQLDCLVYPFEYLTNLGEKSPIATVRIGPENARLGLGKGKTAQEKLAGDSLYAFGGFFKKSWRANDLLWGRLDGLNRIWEGIVNPATVVHFYGFVQREAQRLELSDDAYLELLVRESLPGSSESDQARIKGHLMYLHQPDLQIGAEKLRHILHDFVLIGHRDILKTDLEQVFTDADDQHRQWGSSATQALVFDSHRRKLLAMTQQIAGHSLQSLTLAREQFFRNQYRVGSEQLFANIPGMVLVNLATRGVLVLRDVLLNTGNRQRAQKIRRNPIYKGIDRLLHSFYWWLQGQGTKTVLQVALQPLRLLWRVVVTLLLVILVILLPLHPLFWIALGAGAWIYGQALDQRRRQRFLCSQRRLTLPGFINLP
jgi:patatin-related protein